MPELKLKAEKRNIFGRKIKKLRAEGILPANIYGKNLKSQGAQIDLKEFLKIYEQAGETNIIKLTLAKEAKTRPVLVHNLQVDPVTDQPLHVDFHQVDLKAKVEVAIPIELKGEAPAVAKGGVLVQIMDEVEVEALPTDLPDKFVVDISSINEIGQGISIKDLKVEKNKIKVLVDDEEQLLVKVEEPEKEEEEKPAVEAVAEGEEPVEEEKAEEKAEEKEEEKEEKKEAKEPEKEKEKK